MERSLMNANVAIKYEPRDFKTGMRVEVKVRGGAQGFAWKPGRVKELSGRGAYVKLDEGNSSFFWASDMRPEAAPPKAPEPPRMPRPERPLATIGDAIAARPPLPLKPPAPIAPVVVAAPKPAPPPAPQPLPAKRSKTLHQHHPTPIGDVFRALRLRERTTQSALADLLGCSNKTWSCIELGDSLPDEGLLRRFANFADLPLEELRALRDGRPVDPAPAPQAEREPEPTPAPEPLPEPAAVPAVADDFNDFMDRLCDVAPLPADKDARRRWLQLARELHALTRA